ncbi:MAG TPA: hypothetical protein VJ735_19110 [Actinomycetes bacterium]|nr:hypothetical protein [Actinomycetes bacterium]
MAGRRLLGTAIVTAVAVLTLSATSAAALAAAPDRTPPSAPRIIYLQGYFCLTLIVGVDRSTDNRTPQSQLTYDVFADGRRIGSMADQGSESGVWSIQHLTHTGPNTITVRAVDAAGNRSAPSTGPSTTNVATGFPC